MFIRALTTTETLWTTETAQTWYTNAAYSVILWVPCIPTVYKYLTTLLQPLTDKSRRKLQSTENFIDAIKTVQIPDDYKLVSFNVKSLFTSIPLQLALQCTETTIQQSTVKLPLPTEDIIDLLNLCLTLTYFQYNGKHYKQLHGTAMGLPVSVIVAEIVMQHVEERALATC